MHKEQMAYKERYSRFAESAFHFYKTVFLEIRSKEIHLSIVLFIFFVVNLPFNTAACMHLFIWETEAFFFYIMWLFQQCSSKLNSF